MPLVVVSSKRFVDHIIAQSRKMDYKIEFQPMQGLVNGRWQAVSQKQK